MSPRPHSQSGHGSHHPCHPSHPLPSSRGHSHACRLVTQSHTIKHVNPCHKILSNTVILFTYFTRLISFKRTSDSNLPFPDPVSQALPETSRRPQDIDYDSLDSPLLVDTSTFPVRQPGVSTISLNTLGDEVFLPREQQSSISTVRQGDRVFSAPRERLAGTRLRQGNRVISLPRQRVVTLQEPRQRFVNRVPQPKRYKQTNKQTNKRFISSHVAEQCTNREHRSRELVSPVCGIFNTYF